MINTTQVEKKHLKNIVAPTNGRRSMQGIYLDVKNEVMVATNEHALLVYKIEDCEGDKNSIMPIDVFDINFVLKGLGLKKKDLVFGDLNYNVGEEKTIVTHQMSSKQVEFDNIMGEKYPEYQNVIPSLGEKSKFQNTIGLSRELIQKISSAIPQQYGFLQFKFYADDKAVRIECCEAKSIDSAIYGVIMPQIKQEWFDKEVKKQEEHENKLQETK